MWPILGPPKLAPEGGPGPGGQSNTKIRLILIKRQLQLLLPGVDLFLDVDDLVILIVEVY